MSCISLFVDFKSLHVTNFKPLIPLHFCESLNQQSIQSFKIKYYLQNKPLNAASRGNPRVRVFMTAQRFKPI